MNAKLYGSGLRPLVITSANPFGDVEWQIECAQSFIRSGHDVISFNTAEEQTILRSLNYPGRVERITDPETGKARYGKPVPLILSVLKIALAKNTKQHYILTNSDILYNGRKPCVNGVLGSKEAIALTRVEVKMIQSNKPTLLREGNYRGGLDIFVFTAKGLEETIALVERSDTEVHDMAYGIPGWDYMIGGLILQKLCGTIADGNLFYHKQHQQTYANLENFRPYVKALHSLDCIREAQDPVIAAEQFANIISNECIKHKKWSKSIELCYTKYTQKSSIQCGKASALLRFLPSQVKSICEQLIEETKASPRSSLAEYQSVILGYTDVGAAFREFHGIIATSPSLQIRTRQLLLLATILISIASSRKLLSLKWRYPKVNHHKQVVQPTIDYSKESRLYNIAQVFYSELLEHNIYNASVAKFIVSEITDTAYIQLLQYQLQIIKHSIK